MIVLLNVWFRMIVLQLYVWVFTLIFSIFNLNSYFRPFLNIIDASSWCTIVFLNVWLRIIVVVLCVWVRLWVLTLISSIFKFGFLHWSLVSSNLENRCKIWLSIFHDSDINNLVGHSFDKESLLFQHLANFKFIFRQPLVDWHQDIISITKRNTVLKRI